MTPPCLFHVRVSRDASGPAVLLRAPLLSSYDRENHVGPLIPPPSSPNPPFADLSEVVIYSPSLLFRESLHPQLPSPLSDEPPRFRSFLLIHVELRDFPSTRRDLCLVLFRLTVLPSWPLPWPPSPLRSKPVSSLFSPLYLYSV